MLTSIEADHEAAGGALPDRHAAIATGLPANPADWVTTEEA